MRRYLTFLISIIALAGSLTTVALTIDARDYDLRGYTDATADANLPYRPENRLGVNADLQQYGIDELSHQLTMMEQAGIHWVRQYAYWDQLEQTPGTYDWQTWDIIADAFRQQTDIELVVVLFQSPEWARTSTSLTAPPDDIADFASFAHAFAARYADIIHTYQIWDEPNLDDAWGDAEPRVADYAALLQAGYDAIHSTDANATVLTAALAPTTEISGRNISDWRYLEQLYTFGAKDYMDGVAAKPYGFDTGPEDRAVRENHLNFSRIIGLREVMVAHDDGHKPLWASEWGWNSTQEDWQGESSIWGTVNSDTRTDYTLKALARAEREWPWLGGMILKTWQPDAAQQDAIWGFSLLTPTGEATPLLNAIANRHIPSAATNGLYHPVTSYAAYSGLWTFGPLGADIGWLETSDSRLSFQFDGRDMAMLVRKSDVAAFLYPTVDDQTANALPHDNQGNSYIFLRSASLQPETVLVPVVENLSEGVHTLKAVADRGWDRWALAGYAVSSGNLRQPYDQQIAVAMLTTIAALLASLVSAIYLPWGTLSQRIPFISGFLNTTSEYLLAFLASLILTGGMLLTWTDSGPLIFRREAVQLGLGVVITGGLIALQPGFLLTLLAIIVLLLLFIRSSNVAITLIILYAPFYVFPVELYSFAFPIVEVLVLLAFAAWLTRQALTWAQTYQVTPPAYRQGTISTAIKKLSAIDYAVIAWVIMATITLVWAQYRGYAITEWRVLFIEPAIFYLILRTNNQRDSYQKQWAATLVISGTIVAAVSLIQFAMGHAIITAEDGAWRLAGIYGSPNNLALYIVRCLPFALSAWFATKQLNWRIAITFALLLMLVTIALTQSVAAYILSVPTTIIVVLILKFGRKALLPIGLIVIGGVISFAVLASFSPRFANLLDWTQGTNFLRLRVWESAWDIVTDHPIRGLGLDQFLYVFHSHYIRPDAIWDPDLSHPHNFILDIWLRLSFIGLLIFGWLQFSFWQNIRHALQFPTSQAQWITIGAAASMMGLLMHGLVDNSLFVIDLAYVFMLLLALSQRKQNIHAIDASQKG
ncbi:O-antigen ligase family protein [Phototrophicus methaneseepsis]|uniref:O-antigen ligase family protein n=1 Tax=Phototrophicus methaneseepsis TaxID=2710758 RepID=A0A7S8IC57_9CHLR|nr:O-antigen ligase family protein [Phototrophicus methaneseepsis]QPC81195.1 O-antigen ligase family protein [Phototrophicus methaneseepsis]